MQLDSKPHTSFVCLILSPLCSLPSPCLSPCVQPPQELWVASYCYNSKASLFTKCFLLPDFTNQLFYRFPDPTCMVSPSFCQIFLAQLLLFAWRVRNSLFPMYYIGNPAHTPHHHIKSLLTLSLQNNTGPARDWVPRTHVLPELHFAFLGSC